MPQRRHHCSAVGCITAQVLLEFVSVVTNPKRLASARTATDAWTVADSFAGALTMISATPNLYARASAMGRSLNLARQDVFDLAIAITALEASVTTIYSFDMSVFSKVPGITVRVPSTPSP
jgi:predicted nucleic acid-binding protein